MKNIVKSLFVVAASATLFASCIKETFPMDASATSEQIAKSPSALIASVDGMVATTYQPYFFYGSGNQLEFDISYAGLLITYARLTCDFVNNSATIGYDWWTGYTGSYGYSMSYTTSRQTVPFMTFYKIIKNSNDLISVLANEQDLNDDKKNYLGTAYVYRALMFHDLYCLYLPAENKYTDVSAAAGLTAPIVLSSAEEAPASGTARATKDEMVAQVFSDLDKAEELFIETGYVPNSGLYPSLAVVYGIKARMYMDIEDYANAATYARMAIDESGKTPMTEEQLTDPNSAFAVAAENSWLWWYNISANNMGNLCNPTGFLAGESDWGYNSLTQMAIHKWIYHRINYTDVRKQWFIDPDRETYPASHYKWTSKTDDKGNTYLDTDPFEEQPDYKSFKIRCKNGNWLTYSEGGAVDWPIMRVEELYLIEAEAIGHTQGEAAGIRALESFMQSYRDPAYTYAESSKSFSEGFVRNFYEEVLFQKRVEFFGEGPGFFDAKRLKVGVKTWYKGSNVIHETNQYTIEGVSPFWNLVIPQSETERNNLIIPEGRVPNVDPTTGIMQTVNNPDPTNSVKNDTTQY